MELNINSLPDFVKNATVLWNKSLDSVPQIMRNSGIVREIDISTNTGNTREFSEIDLEEYASRKGESEQARRAKVQQGYTKIGKLYRIAKDIGISYELRTQNKAPEIAQRITNLAKLAPNRIDLDLSHRITFGHSTTYTDKDGVSVDIAIGDGLALFNSAHTLKGSSKTFRNELSGNAALSRTSLLAMEKMRKENTLNQFGEKMTINDDILWTTDDPDTVAMARELLRSTASTESNKNSNVVNIFNGSYTHVVLPRVATDADGNVDSSKATYWGVASSEMSTLYLGMHEEPRMKKPPVAGRNNEEFETDDWNFGVRAGYMVVAVSGNWIGVSKGDGS